MKNSVIAQMLATPETDVATIRENIWRFAVPGSCSGIVIASDKEEALSRAKEYLLHTEYSEVAGLNVWRMTEDETFADGVPYAVIAGY